MRRDYIVCQIKLLFLSESLFIGLLVRSINLGNLMLESDSISPWMHLLFPSILSCPQLFIPSWISIPILSSPYICFCTHSKQFERLNVTNKKPCPQLVPYCTLNSLHWQSVHNQLHKYWWYNSIKYLSIFLESNKLTKSGIKRINLDSIKLKIFLRKIIHPFTSS